MKLATVIASGLLLVASACAGVQTAAVVEPGASFTLAPGETAAVKGADARITLKRVTDDSRCPVDVTCVWAGDAKIEVTISRNGAPEEQRILSITPPKHEAIVGNLRIRFVSLAPVLAKLMRTFRVNTARSLSSTGSNRRSGSQRSSSVYQDEWSCTILQPSGVRSQIVVNQPVRSGRPPPLSTY